MEQSNPFDRFIADVKTVRNERQLVALIADLGVCSAAVADHKIHPRFRRRTIPSGGVWQDPMELAILLWSMKDVWKQQGVSSFIEIGTAAGYTFFAIREFLRAHVSPDVRAKTIDVAELNPEDPIHSLIKDDFQRATSVDLVGEQYDLVFVDGSSDSSWIAKDFQTFAATSKHTVFLNSTWSPANPDQQRQQDVLRAIDDATKGRVRVQPPADRPPSRMIIVASGAHA